MRAATPPRARIFFVFFAGLGLSQTFCTEINNQSDDAADTSDGGREAAVAEAAPEAPEVQVVDLAPTEAGAEAPQGEVGPPAALVPVDGTRLKQRYAVTAGGVSVAIGWQDSTLGDACMFNTASDGELRCLPFSPPSARYHSDPGCLGPPVVVLDADACVPATAISPTPLNPGPCRDYSRYYRRGQRLEGIVRLYERTGASCTPAPPLAPNTVAYITAEELPPQRFVKGKRVVQPGAAGAPLELVAIEAEDGAIAPEGFQNAASKKACDQYVDASGKTRCSPYWHYVEDNHFSDASCSGRTTSFRLDTCLPIPELAATPLDRRACDQRMSMRAVGPRTDTVFLRDATNACLPATDLNQYQYHQVGAPVSDEQFPVLETFPSAPAGQRLAALTRMGGGARAMIDGFYDQERKQRCFPRVLEDGRHHCAPDGMFVGSYYADAACRIPLWWGVDEGCADSFAYAPLAGGSCPRRYQMHQVGTRYFGAVYRQSEPGQPGTCSPATEYELQFYDFRMLTPVPATDFAELSVRQSR